METIYHFAGVIDIDIVRPLALAEYVARADAAMYETKKRGKGRAVLWLDTMAPK